ALKAEAGFGKDQSGQSRPSQDPPDLSQQVLVSIMLKLDPLKHLHATAAAI
ncbi:hypothetical protein BGZ82_003478, partial [Podila clonocystis]